MKKLGLNSPKREAKQIDESTAKELAAVVGKADTLPAKMIIARNPLEQIIGKSFRKDRNDSGGQIETAVRALKNCRAVIDEKGTIENNLTCEECKFVLALQILLTQQTENIADKVEVCTESPKRQEQRVQRLSQSVQEIEAGAQLLTPTKALSVTQRKNPNFEGIDLSNLSPSALDAINEVASEQGTTGKVIATPAKLLFLMGKGRNKYGENKVVWLENTLEAFKTDKFVKIEENAKEGFALAQNYIVKNYETYISFTKQRISRFYKIELSDLFTKKAASNFIALPPNYCEIVDAIKEKPFFFLFRWLLLELSENRRNEQGVKINHFTAISQRGEVMNISQPFRNEQAAAGTDENGKGVLDMLFSSKELAKTGAKPLKARLENWLVTLRDFGFVRNFTFTESRVQITLNRIKRTDVPVEDYDPEGYNELQSLES